MKIENPITIVFGGAGFIGGHVADELTKRGHKVFIFDKVQSPFISGTQEMIIGDSQDLEAVKKAVQGCDYVYNFSGIAGIKDARENPRDTILINVMGNTNILEACRHAKIKRYVFASTVYVYSDLAPFYRASKQSCEIIIEDYQKEYGIDYTILRYGSLYGPRANSFNTIRNLIGCALKDKKIIHYGNPEDKREYIHVLDAARTTVDVLDDEFKNECVMLTGETSIKVSELMNLLNEIFGGTLEIEYRDAGNNGHYTMTPYTFRPKLAKKISHKVRYDFGQGLLESIYEQHLEEKN